MKIYVANTPIGELAISEKGELAADLQGEIVRGAQAEAFVRMHFRKAALATKTAEELNKSIIDFSLAQSMKAMEGSIGMDRFLIQASNALEDTRGMENLMLERFSEWYRLHYPEARASHKELLSLALKHGTREKFPGFSTSV